MIQTLHKYGFSRGRDQSPPSQNKFLIQSSKTKSSEEELR